MSNVKQQAEPDKYVGLTVRHYADKSHDDGTRVKGTYQGKECLVCRITGKPKPWPSLGWEIVNPEIPEKVKIPTKVLSKWIEGGLVTVQGVVPTNYPGGPPSNPWRSDKVHNFQEHEFITFHTRDRGEVKYKVVQQPGKYHLDADNPTSEQGKYVRLNEDPSRKFTAEDVQDGVLSKVCAYYLCELVK